MIVVGEMDRLVQIERQVIVLDARVNARVVEWAPHGQPVWAQVVESSTPPGSNPAAGEDLAGYVRPTKVRIRWRADIDKATMRINHGGRILRITGTAELGRRERIELACEEWAHEHG